MTELVQINPSIAKTPDPWLARPKVSTAPPGLRNYKPSPAPIPRPTRSPAQQVGPPQEHNIARMAACGTESALRRHHRNREEPCDECVAGRDRRRSERAAVGTGNACRERRGSRTGYTRHYRAKERACRDCKDAYNAETTARRHKQRAARKETAE